MEIINWLRGGNIFILTLQFDPLNASDITTSDYGMGKLHIKGQDYDQQFDEMIPIELRSRPQFTQWVFSDKAELLENIDTITNGLASVIYNHQVNTHDDTPSNPLGAVQVKPNPDIENKTPDCVMVIDIQSNPLYFSTVEDYDNQPYIYYRLIVTQFVKKGMEWK